MSFTFDSATGGLATVGASPDTSPDASFASTISIGDLLLVVCTPFATDSDVISSVTDTLGNTYASAAFSPSNSLLERIRVYWCQSAFAGSNTAVVTHSNTSAVGVSQCRIAVSSGTVAVDKIYELTGTSSTPSGTLTGVAANSFIFAGSINNGGNLTVPATYTSIYAGTGYLYSDGAYINDSGASGDKTITWSGTVNWTALAVSFTTGGGGPTSVVVPAGSAQRNRRHTGRH